MRAEVCKEGKHWRVRLWTTRPFHESSIEQTVFSTRSTALEAVLSDALTFIREYTSAVERLDEALRRGVVT